MKRPTVHDISASGADVLRRTVCGHEEAVGDLEQREKDGWPKRCDETMFLGVSRQRPPLYNPRGGA